MLLIENAKAQVVAVETVDGYPQSCAPVARADWEAAAVQIGHEKAAGCLKAIKGSSEFSGAVLYAVEQARLDVKIPLPEGE